MLTLYNVTEAESGEYVCKVSNYIGEANQSAWLTVTRPLAKGNRKDAQWDASGAARPQRWKAQLWALSFLLYFWCKKPWKNTPRGRLGCVLHPPRVLPAPCRPRVSVLVHPRRDAQPALPELYFSMWPIASMLRWAGPLVKGF